MCRLEGLFGIRPMGLNSFSFSPKLPEGWNDMALRNIKSFNKTFDIEVSKVKENLLVKVFSENQIFLDTVIKNGEKINLDMFKIKPY